MRSIETLEAQLELARRDLANRDDEVEAMGEAMAELRRRAERADALRTENAKLRAAVRDALSMLRGAVRAGIEGMGFDVEKHHGIARLRAALATSEDGT